MTDGGDNIAHITFIFLCFTNSTAYQSLRPTTPKKWSRRAITEINTAVHNLAIVAIAFQVFVVYYASAMYKIQGRMWQDGVALYYILRVPEFSGQGFRSWPTRTAGWCSS